jgi:hypothetical protein
MASKNTNNQTTAQRFAAGELLTTPQAIEMLGYAGADKGKGQGAFLAAVKSHDYLRAAKVEKTSAFPLTLWEKDAILRYADERKSGGGQSRDGAKWYSERFTDDEAARLSQVASDLFGRTIVFEQPAKRAARIAEAKAANATNGVNAPTVESTEDELDTIES